MFPDAFLSLLAAGFAVAFLHAATPTHWLPLVLVGRAQGWTRGRTLGVAAVAGLGHALFTALLGLAVTGAGHLIEPALGALFPRLIGWAILALGLFYLARHVLRPNPPPETEAVAEAAKASRRYGSDLAAMAGIVAYSTFTPPEAVLPIYMAGIGNGWLGFTALATVLVVAATAGVLVFTALFMAGAERLKLQRLERYEFAVVGLCLCVIGAMMALAS